MVVEYTTEVVVGAELIASTVELIPPVLPEIKGEAVTEKQALGKAIGNVIVVVPAEQTVLPH